MTSSDDKSTVIGSLTAKADSAEDQRRALFEKQAVLERDLAGMIYKMGTAQDDISALQAQMEDYKATKQRIIGMMTIIGLLGGGIGAGVATVGGDLFGGAP